MKNILCFIERINKNELNNLNLWMGDKIFFTLLNRSEPFFSLKLVYNGGDQLIKVMLNGKELSEEEWEASAVSRSLPFFHTSTNRVKLTFSSTPTAFNKLTSYFNWLGFFTSYSDHTAILDASFKSVSASYLSTVIVISLLPST